MTGSSPEVYNAMIDPAPAPPSVRDVMDVTAHRYGCTVEELQSGSRQLPLVIHRQRAMAAARLATQASYPAIAKAFGGRDHTTVMHACRRRLDDPEVQLLAEAAETLSRRGRSAPTPPRPNPDASHLFAMATALEAAASHIRRAAQLASLDGLQPEARGRSDGR